MLVYRIVSSENSLFYVTTTLREQFTVSRLWGMLFAKQTLHSLGIIFSLLIGYKHFPKLQYRQESLPFYLYCSPMSVPNINPCLTTSAYPALRSLLLLSTERSFRGCRLKCLGKRETTMCDYASSAFTPCHDCAVFGRSNVITKHVCSRRPRRVISRRRHVIFGTVEHRNSADTQRGEEERKEIGKSIPRRETEDKQDSTDDRLDHNSLCSSTDASNSRDSPTNSTSSSDGKYADMDLESREKMLELDRLAEEWIGTDINRWHWYENMKSRRNRLTKLVKSQEDSLEKDLNDLRTALTDLDSLLHLGFLDEPNGRITSAGWLVVFLSFAANAALFYAGIRVISAAIEANFPPSTF